MGKVKISKENVQKSKDYFQIVHQGYNKDLQREEIEINCGENGKLMIIKTEEGFVIDVYGQADHINSMAIWEDDLDPKDLE